jgi:RNA polymerase sigma-70 factor (ECF subfamily)
LAGEENWGVLRNCLDRLPEEFREVLVLRELEEMSYKDIGAITGLAIGTVMSRLSRGRKRLADCAGRRKAEAKA